MGKGLSDTSPEAEAQVDAVLKAMPVHRRLELMADLSSFVQGLVIRDLERRHPDLSPIELRSRWIELAGADRGG